MMDDDVDMENTEVELYRAGLEESNPGNRSAHKEPEEMETTPSPSHSEHTTPFFKSSPVNSAKSSGQTSPDQTQNQEDRAGPGGSDPEVLAVAQQDLYTAGPGGSGPEVLDVAQKPSTVHEGPQLNLQNTGVTGQTLNGSDQGAESPAADVKETSSSVTKSSDRNKPSDDVEKGAPDRNETLNSPSAPQDVSVVYVKVDWTGALPEKWKYHLEKALQTLCNTERTVNGSINEVRILTDGCTAELEVTPSTAFSDIKTATLTFKQLNKEAKVYFQKAEAQFENKSFSLKTEKTDVGTIPTPNMMGVGAASPDPGHDVMPGASGALTVPPFLYCYLIQAYRKEMKQIENKFGVKINAETCISFSTEKTEKNGSDNVRRATEAFSDLYQANAYNLKSISVPQTHMESEIMKEVLRNIPNEENKIMLNMSASNHLLFGPGHITSIVEQRLNLDRGDEGATSFNYSKSHNMETSSNSTQKTFQSLDMDMKDTPTWIEMDLAHWQLMEAACKEQMIKIQTKYGVEFHVEPVQGSIKVFAHSVETQFSLQAHAISALTRLYQKVVTSAVTCDLKDASYTEKVSQVFERIPSPCVGGGERNGSWKLFGLPKHLVPTIADIEKTLGHSAFDGKRKEMLGYPWNSDVMRGAHGTDLRGEDNPDFTQKFTNKAKENDKEEDNCPICLDTFTEKTKLDCGHEFCKECLKQSIQSGGEICPLCKKIFGKLKGNQPHGEMRSKVIHKELPGFKGWGTIVIDYYIPDGTQTSAHPNHGSHYRGTHRTAYLPNNTEGKHVLTLLKRAFDQKLIFTVGFSRTTGADNVVIWNDIHHKTSIDGGPQMYGYPDPDYFKRVKEELKAKGIE